MERQIGFAGNGSVGEELGSRYSDCGMVMDGIGELVQ